METQVISISGNIYFNFISMLLEETSYYPQELLLIYSLMWAVIIRSKELFFLAAY